MLMQRIVPNILRDVGGFLSVRSRVCGVTSASRPDWSLGVLFSGFGDYKCSREPDVEDAQRRHAQCIHDNEFVHSILIFAGFIVR